MKRDPKVIVIMPAYNAARTLEKTYHDIPKDCVDEVLLVDDKSQDSTVEVARKLRIDTIVHDRNKGYGGNQKTCYTEAIKRGADIIIMLHPDYQYDPKKIPEMIEPIKRNEADVVFGSRMMKKGGALDGGMPFYKFLGNKFLTTLQNMIFQKNISEYHTGFRAFSRDFLESVNFMSNSEGFGFDSQIVGQIMKYGFRLTEIDVETRYLEDSSSVTFTMSVIYGLDNLKMLADYILFTLKKRS